MDAASAEDLFQPFAKVKVKKLFGGLGIYHDDLIFACVIRGEVFLRTDPETEPAFAAAGSHKWNYVHDKSKAKVAMPYWRMPDVAFDDEAELVRFSRMAIEAAGRAKAMKTKAAKLQPAKPKSTAPKSTAPKPAKPVMTKPKLAIRKAATTESQGPASKARTGKAAAAKSSGAAKNARSR